MIPEELGLPDRTGLFLPVVDACCISSKPALLWKRLSRFTTLGEVCVLTLTGPNLCQNRVLF